MTEERLKELLDRAPLPMIKQARKDSHTVQLWIDRYDKWYMDVNSELYGLQVDKWVNPLDKI